MSNFKKLYEIPKPFSQILLNEFRINIQSYFKGSCNMQKQPKKSETFIPFKTLSLSFLFFITSCQHHSPGPEINEATRIPSSEQNCAEIISSFYQKQDLNRIQSRIKATKNDPHKFLRSFPPHFYKIADDLKLESLLGDVYKHKSVIGGDVHVENFGVRKFKDQHRLLINDFDDLSEGNTVLDLVRLLTSMKFTGHDVDKKFVKKFLKRYLEGAQGEKENFSKVTEEFFKEAKKNKSRISKNKIDVVTKKFIKKREPSFEMSKAEIDFWKKEIKEYGELKDSYKYIKESGGSGGLDRYELLVEKEGELIWLEVKEWETPGINAGLGTKAPSFEKRLGHVLKYDQPEIPATTFKYNHKVFFLREINEGHVGLALDVIKKKEMEDLYLDEAYALGNFHRTFNISKQYIKDIEEIDRDNLLEAVEKVHDEVSSFIEK